MNNWDEIVHKVDSVVRKMPLWQLQTVGRIQIEFLYENRGAGATIELKPGVAFCLRRFHVGPRLSRSRRDSRSRKSSPPVENPVVPLPRGKPTPEREKKVFSDFAAWLAEHVEGNPVFVSDNPAFDWQWINDGFWRTLGYNPFGHSGRRISDFYAGLVGDFHATQKWKRLRVTPHDHNPVHDAMGNVEAFERILKGER